MPSTDRCDAAEYVGKALLLAKLGQFVHSRDNHRRQIPIDVVIHDVERQPVLAARAFTARASVLEDSELRVVARLYISVTERAMEQLCVSCRNTRRHIPRMALVIDLVWCLRASDEIPNREP